MGQHDLNYRLFFAHRRMIQDLLRDIVGERWVDLIDLDSAEEVDASFLSPRSENRESALIWRFRRKNGEEPVYVYILMEFLSRPDPSVPFRLMGDVSLFYESFVANQTAAALTFLPLIIPMVVYNGLEPWNMATDLGSWIGDLHLSAEIYRLQWRYRLVDVASYSREDLATLSSPVADLFRLERFRDWSEIPAGDHRPRWTIPATERRQEGYREGEARMLLRQLRLKFGPLDSTLEEQVRSADADRLLEWGERVLDAELLEDVFRG
jgi:hypothetical protein